MDKPKDIKHRVTIALKRHALLYDIENLAYIEGQVVETEDDHKRHTIIDAGQKGNVDRVTRMMNLAVTRCVETLYPYTKIPIGDNMLTDDFYQPKEYIIELLVPGGMSFTTINFVKNLMHEYVVASVLYDWTSITDKPAADAWLMKAETARSQILESLSNRCGPLHRKLSPF